MEHGEVGTQPFSELTDLCNTHLQQILASVSPWKPFLFPISHYYLTKKGLRAKMAKVPSAISVTLLITQAANSTHCGPHPSTTTTQVSGT